MIINHLTKKRQTERKNIYSKNNILSSMNEFMLLYSVNILLRYCCRLNSKNECCTSIQIKYKLNLIYYKQFKIKDT